MPRINQLTPKMIKFCECIVSGLMPIDAYKTAYNADKMSDNSIRREAYILMQRDDITAYVNDLRKPIQNLQKNAVISESDRIKAKLWEIIQDEDEKTENKIRSMDILNKMNQIYNNQVTTDSNKDELTDVDSSQLIELIKAV